ncbi:MAG: hypothetical protein V1820_05820 [archaeon]
MDFLGRTLASRIRKMYLPGGEDVDWDAELREISEPLFSAAAEFAVAELALLGSTAGETPVCWIPSGNMQHSTEVFHRELSERGKPALVVGGDLVSELVRAAGEKLGWQYFYDQSSLDGNPPPGYPVLERPLETKSLHELTGCGKQPVLVAANALKPPLEASSAHLVYDRLGATWHAAYQLESLLDRQLAAFDKVLVPGGLLLIDSSNPAEVTKLSAKISTYDRILRCRTQNCNFSPEKIHPKDGVWQGPRYSFEAEPIETAAGEEYIRLKKIA